MPLPAQLAVDWAANCSHHLALVQVSPVKAFNLIIILVLSGSTTASVCWSKILWLIEWGEGGYRISVPSLSNRLNVRIIGTGTGSCDLCLCAPLLREPLSLSPDPFLFFFLYSLKKKSRYFYSPVNSPQKPTDSKSRIVVNAALAQMQQLLNVTKGRDFLLKAPAGERKNTEEEALSLSHLLHYSSGILIQFYFF